METEACAGQGTYTEILDDELLQKKLDRLARHHTRIERTFHRCLKELKTLQAQRTKEDTMPVPERTESALSAISERSQSAAPVDAVSWDTLQLVPGRTSQRMSYSGLPGFSDSLPSSS